MKFFLIIPIIAFFTLNTFAESKIPKDVKKHIIHSVIINSKPDFRKLAKIKKSNITWEDVYNLNVTLLLNEKFHSYYEYSTSIKTLMNHPNDCINHYSNITQVINNKFSYDPKVVQNLISILDKVCKSNMIDEESETDNYVVRSEENMPSPFEILDHFLTLTEKLPKFLRSSFQKPIIDIKETVFKDVSNDYGNGNIGGHNTGLINYLSFTLANDPQLAYDSLKFYNLIYSSNPGGDTNHGQVWDHSDLNFWKVAMNVCDNDPWRAIRVIGLKGHDVAANALNNKYFTDPNTKPLINLVEITSASRDKRFYQNGSISGIRIPNKIIKMFDFVKAQSSQLGRKDYFRAGNYHFIAGALVSEELLRKNNKYLTTVRVPTFIEDILGYSYKRIRILKYLTKDAVELFNKGCRFDKCKQPYDWNDKRYLEAMYSLNSNLAFLKLTAWQHGAGARFAWNVLHKKY